MRADADKDAIFGIGGAMPVFRVRRLLGLLGVRVGKPRDQLRILQDLQEFRRPSGDENRVILPAHHDLLAGLQLAEIEVDGASGGERRRIRVHLGEHRHKTGDAAHDAKSRGHDIEKVATGRRRHRVGIRQELGMEGGYLIGDGHDRPR
ncbi:MAG: hypothetical protein BGO65_04665 [Afipia sp. 64-13]|nr:MAG: hypothetical protein BGO65_04665 [Afipia sp. 64-13]